MKVELNIDAANIGDTVVDLFKNLTEEHKQILAKQVVDNWFNMPYGAERELKERQAIEQMRKDPEYTNREESYIRKDYKFGRLVGEFKGIRELFLAEATKQTVDLVSKAITDRLSADPEIQKMVEEGTAEIKQNFPKFVHDAMVVWFCSNMHSMTEGIAQSLVQSKQNLQVSDSIQQRLNSRGY